MVNVNKGKASDWKGKTEKLSGIVPPVAMPLVVWLAIITNYAIDRNGNAYVAMK